MKQDREGIDAIYASLLVGEPTQHLHKKYSTYIINFVKMKTKYKQTEIGEIPEEWELRKLQDVAKFSNGYAFSSKSYVDEKYDAVPIFKMGNINIGGGLKITGKEDYASQDIVKQLGSYLTKKGDILMCMTDMKSSMNLLGHSAQIHNEIFLVNQRVGIIRHKSNIDGDFLYYFLNSPDYIKAIRTTARSGVQVNLTTEAIRESLVLYPSMSEQQQIASILSSLDDKIELNRKMNKTLEDMAKALFKHWFVDFEFPNEEGKPYKSSGGEMVESELGMIPKGWVVGCLADAISVHDSKRKPLSSMEREKRKGAYPYYGATGILDYVDKYIFDGVYVLLGEDGSVAKEDGSPYTQYVWGQFWVSNHAHVLQGARGFSTEYIKVLLDMTDITAYVTGAVQPKLNQENMNTIPIIIPSTSVLKIFNGIMMSFFIQMATYSIQIETITHIRDSLLPKLMSGKIRTL